MNDLLMRPAFAIYALSCVVLVLNLFALAGLTGGMRNKTKVVLNHEDRKVNSGAKVDQNEADRVARLLRAHRNALENFVPFAVIGLLYVLMGATGRGAAIFMGTFVAARILHSVVYLWAKQPWRTIIYAVGVLATMGMLVQVTRVLLVLL
ncbi:MAG TPA: MAPEG family protein [Polyangiaceae bacterium]|jgi:uncharacterized MAPEG superfamily protein